MSDEEIYKVLTARWCWYDSRLHLLIEGIAGSHGFSPFDERDGPGFRFHDFYSPHGEDFVVNCWYYSPVRDAACGWATAMLYPT